MTGRRRALVTGASSGIGFELARQFAAADFDLVINAEDHQRLAVVTSLMPGPTETDFFRRADMLDTRVGSSSKDDPAQVAKQGFEAVMAGKRRVVGGSLKTKVSEAANKMLPDQAKAVVHGKMAEPGSGKG